MTDHPPGEHGVRGGVPPRLSTRWQQRLARLTYRLRPEQPSEGLEYIQIAAGAQQRCFPTQTPLTVVVWNTFKGRRERYYDVLAAQAGDADLILLQEFCHDPALEAAHQQLFAGRDAGMVVGFYTQANHTAPTGVCTISAVRAMRTIFLLSRYREPVTRTPKTAICTYYRFGGEQQPPQEALVVLNSHGINFRLRRPFLDQMLQFEAHLRHHRGPMILVGDFNTWERGRVRILEHVAGSLGLQAVRFPPGVKTFRGHELDRVYVRGGAVHRPRVISDRLASDHGMLVFQFVLQ